jgi:hypothetical protein
MQRQFGQFVLMVGGLLLVLFVISYIANQINFWLFLSGGLLTYFGVRLLIKFPAEPKPKAERFRMVKKINSRRKKKDDGATKKNNKDKKKADTEKEEEAET